MKFLKVVYFDESSVADFLQIIAGGEIKKTTELITNINADAQAGVNIDAGINTDAKGLSKLFSFLTGVHVNANINAEAEAGYRKDRIVKNILENTLLADFIDLIKNDKKRKPDNQRTSGIKIFNKLSVYPETNSLSYFMLAGPYLSMLDGDLQIPSDDGTQFKFNIAKLEQAIDRGRGYYEFISDYEGKEIVLRFNIIAFRNNYTMSDLPKMQLTFYAVHVGEMDKQKLKIEKEFEFGTRTTSRADYSGLSQHQDESNYVNVYDVILAGIVDE